MPRPTETAEMLFSMARQHIAPAHSPQGDQVPKGAEVPAPLINSVTFMIDGLSAMNTGLRATYMKLEEIERLLKQLRPR